MPSDEYAPVVRGSLKLKGSKPDGVKKKKKKPKEADAESSSATKKAALQEALEEEDGAAEKETKNKNPSDEQAMDEERLKELDPRGGDGKTASERAYEDMRRRRLNDRLQKEGVKTHKQRVEELNKYLSNLSEHHDMPRIGPG